MVCAAKLQGNSPVDASPSKTVVEVEQGKLMGYIDNGIYIFRGVPYAKAERFMMPEKMDPWDGIRNATTYGEICPQFNGNSIALDEYFNPHIYLQENENCQFLNINTPAINDGKKRPVMVWLHGGAFSAGSSCFSAY